MTHILTHSETDQIRAFVMGLLAGRPDLLIDTSSATNPMRLVDSHEELASIIADLVMVEEQNEVTRHANCFHTDALAASSACPKTPPALVRGRAALAAMQQPGRII